MRLHRTIRAASLWPTLCAGLAALLSAALYGVTLAPTATWYDMAELPAAAYHLGIAHSTGYPLYLLLGRLFTFLPLGDVGYRVNLMSAFFAALTVFLVSHLIWTLTQKRIPAFTAALTLGVSSALWSKATVAEVHTLNAFLTALITLLLLIWSRSGRRTPLLGAFFVFGLGMGNHHLIQFLGPAMLAYWAHASKRRGECLRWTDLPVFGLLFLGGFSVNLYLPIRAAQQPVLMWADASDWRTFLRMIAFGQGKESMPGLISLDPGAYLARLRALSPYPLYEYTVFGVALAVWGALRLWHEKRSFALYSFLGTGLTLLFAVGYGVHDVFEYLLPIYVIMALYIGVGTAALIDTVSALSVRMMAGASVALPKASITVLVLILLGLPVYLVTRDFEVLDRHDDSSSFLFANYLAGHLGPNVRMLNDFWTWAPLVYQRTVAGWRSDVLLYGTLSSLDIDWAEFLASLAEEKTAIYVGAGGPMPPELQSRALLHPVGIGVIETMTDFGVPSPQHKDLLLPWGNLYRMVSRPPLLEVSSVPASRRIDEIHFGDSLTLMGFGGPAEPQQLGSSPKLSYYWMLNTPTEINYYVKVRLVDASGAECQLRELPTWDHSHLIGGLSPTSTWKPGTLMGERYDTLISWRLRSGRYTLKAWVFEDEEQRRQVLPLSRTGGDGVILGELEVLPRDGPFDVAVQTASRE